MFGRKKRRLLTWSVIISSVAGLTSCGSEGTTKALEGYTLSGNTQGTTYTIIVAEEDLHFGKTDIDSVLAQFDTVLSTYIPTSHISQLNNAAQMYNFYDRTGFFRTCYAYSDTIFKESNGAFDPSVFPLMKGWGFFKKMSTPLEPEKVDSIRQFVSFEPGKLHATVFRNDSVFFHKLDARFMLDFNAIAQGYSVDVIHDFIRSRGHRNVYVEIGGEIRVSGVNREGSDWLVGIDTPAESNTGGEERAISGILSLRNKAVATSGNYRNFYEKEGKKYAHTLDPSTGYPVQHNLLSATVIADNCALADGLATAFMVIGLEKTKALLQTMQLHAEVVLIYEADGKMQTYISEGAKGMFDR